MKALKRIGIARGGWLLLSCVAVTFSGCAAQVDSEPGPGAYPGAVGEDVVYVDTVPPDIEAYPHYYYGGGYAYYVEGRWYRRGERGWGYYRQEPPQLAQHRAQAAREAPSPAVPRERERSGAEQAPSASRARPSVQEAPAASRPSPAPGVVEKQPASGAASRRARPAPKSTAPPKEHER
jgi:hypothetical protein